MQGETYTISFEIVTTTTIGFYWYPSERYSKSGYITGSEQWQKVSFTYTQTGVEISSATLFGFQGLVGGNVYYYKNLKLEKGNKATDWTPAIEDIDGAIADVKEITTSNSTTIGIQQGQITTAINNTQIIKDGQTILLKDDYNRTVITVNSSLETIGSHTSLINANTGAITGVTTDVVQVKKDLTGVTTRVGSSETNIITTTATANNALINANKGITDSAAAKTRADLGVANASTAQIQANKGVSDALLASNKAGQALLDSKAYTTSEINTVTTKVSTAQGQVDVLKSQILLKVEANDVNTAVTNIVVGVRNLLRPTKLISYGPYNTISADTLGKVTLVKKHAQYIAVSMPGFTPINKSYTISGIATLDGQPITRSFFVSNRADTHNIGSSIITVDSTGYFTITETWIGNSIWIFHCYVGGTIGSIITFDKLKMEIGNKATDYTPAQEDIDQAILDSITLNTTNIKQAKAEILLETNAIKLSVSGVDNKVTTVTTTANSALTNASTAQTQANLGVNNAKGALDKANLVDGRVTTLNTTVTATNTKVAGIEVNLNGITSRVTAEEKKSTAIDGKVIAQDTRLTSAESKITSSAIISTVQVTINTAKTDAINSSNSATDGKLNAYSTTSLMTSAITQSANSIKQEVSNTYITSGTANNIFATKATVALTDTEWRATFKSSGGYNITKNGQFLNDTYNWWEHSYESNGSGKRWSVISPNSEWCLDGRNCLQINATWTTKGNYGAGQTLTLKRNMTYTLSGYQASHRCIGYVYVQKNGSDWAVLNNITLNDTHGSKNENLWNKFEITFTTASDWAEYNIFLKIQYSEADGVCWYTDIMLEEGITKTKYTPSPSELYNGNTVIDASGITIYNGAIKVLDGAGNEVLKGDANGISFSGRLQPRDNTIKLFGENCRIDGSAGAIRLQKDPYNYVAVDNSATVFYNGYSNAGTIYIGLATDAERHSQLYNQTTMIKLLNRGAPALQARSVGDGGYCPMQASSFTVSSKQEFKEYIHYPEEIDFKKILTENDIKAYNYKTDIKMVDKMPTVVLADGSNPIKADKKIGLVIEELTEDARALLNPTGSEGVDLYSMGSILWKVAQEHQVNMEMFIRLIIPFIKLVSQKLEINTEELNKKLEQLLIM